MLALILAVAMTTPDMGAPPETATQKVERLRVELADAETAARLEKAARAVNAGMKRRRTK